MATIYDLVTSANIVSYWTEKNVNTQPFLGATLFPTVKELGTKLEYIKGSSNQPVALRLSSYDAKAIRRDREGLKEVETKMPFFKESVYIDEDMRQKLNDMLQTNNQNVINTVLSKIFDDEARLIDSSEISLERMRMELITTGTITLSSNGQSYSYDYGLDSDTQKITVTKSWSDPSADIIGDINNIVSSAKARGVNITRAICNSTVTKYFRTNTAIKNAIYVFANGTVNVSDSKALEFIFNETGVRFVAYDNVYVNESGQAIKYVPDDTVSFLPDGDLGQTHMGTTPEESDLMNKLYSDVSIVNTGVAVTTYGTEDPVNVETKVSMVALPSFEQADKIVILDVVKD